MFDIGRTTSTSYSCVSNVFANSNLDQPCWNTLWGPWVVCWFTSRTIRDINPIKNDFLKNRICLFHFLVGNEWHSCPTTTKKPQAWLINGLNNMFLSSKINNISNIKAITQEWIYQWIKQHVSVWQHRHISWGYWYAFSMGNYCFGLWYGHLCAEPPVPWWSYGDWCLEYHFAKDMSWRELRCCSWPGVKQNLRIDIMIYYELWLYITRRTSCSRLCYQSVLEWTSSSLFQLMHHSWF